MASRIAGFSREQTLEWSDDSTHPLFYVEHWPYKFQDRYNEARTGKQRVAALRARVEYYIATGK